MSIALGVISLVAVASAVAAMAAWGVRERFDPFDAWLLAIAGYLGCLIVAGFLLDALPAGLTRATTFATVAVGGLVGLGLLRFAWPARLPRLTRPHRPRRPLLAMVLALAVVVSAGALVASLWFARTTEVRALQSHGLVAYLAQDGSSVSVHNPTSSVRSFVLAQRTADVTGTSPQLRVSLAPGQTWRAPTVSSTGRVVITVTPAVGDPLDLVLIDEVPDLAGGRIGTGW